MGFNLAFKRLILQMELYIHSYMVSRTALTSFPTQLACPEKCIVKLAWLCPRPSKLEIYKLTSTMKILRWIYGPTWLEICPGVNYVNLHRRLQYCKPSFFRLGICVHGAKDRYPPYHHIVPRNTAITQAPVGGICCCCYLQRCSNKGPK